MTGEIHAPTRGGEWRCLCLSAFIRAASCEACQKCGATRGTDRHEAVKATKVALLALDVFKRELERTKAGTTPPRALEVAAMAAALAWYESEGRKA